MKFEKTLVAESPEKIQLFHVVAEGTHEEIGYQLGRLAKTTHNIDKSTTANPSDIKSQYNYLKKHYPAHYARMTGFAKAYQKTLGDYNYDFSFFGNMPGGAACSAVYYPPAVTRSQHGYISRNLDFSIPGNISPEKTRFPFKQSYVIEMYPKTSYSSISLFCFEVLGLALEGINSEGLAVVHLADIDTKIDHETLATGKTRTGFNEFLPIQYLLDTCSTAEEAMKALKHMTHYHMAIPVHLLIADKQGNSFVFEYSPDGAGKVFIQGDPSSPLKITNFQLNRLSDPAMKKVMESRFAENGIDRYQVLEKRISQIRFPVTEKLIQETNVAVYVNQDTGEHLERTLFHNIYDTSSCSVKICLLPTGDQTRDKFFSFSLSGYHDLRLLERKKACIYSNKYVIFN